MADNGVDAAEAARRKKKNDKKRAQQKRAKAVKKEASMHSYGASVGSVKAVVDEQEALLEALKADYNAFFPNGDDGTKLTLDQVDSFTNLKNRCMMMNEVLERHLVILDSIVPPANMSEKEADDMRQARRGLIKRINGTVLPVLDPMRKHCVKMEIPQPEVDETEEERQKRMAQAAVVHTGIQCQQCLRTDITGIRYKCKTCHDYDMCDSCHSINNNHDVGHRFEKILDTSEYRKSIGTTHEGVSCDACGTVPIVGIRWKCQSCPDFDMCSECYDTKAKHISGHGFTNIPDSYRYAIEQKVLAARAMMAVRKCALPECGAVEDASAAKKFPRCHKCASAYYCTRKHQTLHWKSGHREECTQ